LITRQIPAKNHFGHKKGTGRREHDVQCSEEFTDAVFALAITLLAVSPETREAEETEEMK